MRVGTPAWDLPSLVEVADVIVIASALEDRSCWEEGRIVTYSRARLDRAIAGHLGDEPLWIRTKGGTLGSICQFVDGEAVLQKTWPSLLFLVRTAMRDASGSPADMSPAGKEKLPATGFEVAGGAFGQFPIVLGAQDEPRAIPSPWLCVLNPVERELRLDPFSSVTLDKISRDLSKSWARLHAAPTR